ncbi:MAG: PAS domain S-box protein [Cyclobacteriaceae bacterium]
MEQKSGSQSQKQLEEKIALLERRLDREKKARVEAEQLLESKSLELFDAYTSLEVLNKSLEKNISRRTETLMTLINNLHSGVLLNDEHGKILLVNQKFREVFHIKLSESELIGTDQRDSAKMVKGLFKEPEKFISIVDQCIDTNDKVLNYELEMINNKIVDCDFIPIRSEGDFVGHLWQVRDVTDERLTQKKIAYSEEKYRGIIENMELGLLEVDEDHRILRAYDSFCEMTGYQEAELLGKNAVDTFLPVDFHERMKEEDKKREEGQQSVYETRMIKKNGDVIWVLISGAPFYDEDGNVIGSVGIHYNISERKELEQQLKEAKNQAENAREAEKQFLANMSHEIRNPINAIIGMTNLLYDTRLSKPQLDYLNNIKFSSDILLGLISGILDISKIESGEFELVEKEIDISDTLSALIEIANFRGDDKDIDIVLKLDEAIDFKVVADPTVLNQIFLNLVNNALKFTEKGSITITGVVLERSDDEALLVFAVKDTGVGIPPEKMKDIFESFNQGDSETKLKYGGTGLGLAIVKQLVGKYQGVVDVESEVGHGSTFQFTLQLKIGKGHGAGVQHYKVKSKSAHILIVEDNQINQQYLSGILKNWDLSYDIANNGQEGLDLIEANKYDIVLMDIRMPIMDGYESTIRIRSNHQNENASIPIVALTASALVDEREKALEVGMNYHLTKPFTPDQLAKVLTHFDLVNMVETGGDDTFVFSDDLNVTYLEEFYANDLDRAQVMFEIFLKTIDTDIDKLRDLMKAKKWKAFGLLAHKIKPNFSMVGLSDLSEIMKEYEAADDNESVVEKIIASFALTMNKFDIGKRKVEEELLRMNKYLKG